VYHTLLVSFGKGVSNLKCNPGCSTGFKGSVPLDVILECPSDKALHDYVVDAVRGKAPVVDRDDIGVGEAGGGLGLSPETLNYPLVVGVSLIEYLERHITVRGFVIS
jgi:hypothetical protein